MASAGAWVFGVPERSSQADTSAASCCSRAPCTAAAAHSRVRAQRLRRPAFNSAACKLGLGGGHSEQVATDAVYHEAAAQDTGKKVAKRVTCCNTAVQQIVQHAAPTHHRHQPPGIGWPGAHAGHRIASHRMCVRVLRHAPPHHSSAGRGRPCGHRPGFAPAVRRSTRVSALVSKPTHPATLTSRSQPASRTGWQASTAGGGA